MSKCEYYIIFIAARHKGNRQNVPRQGNILAISAIAKSDCPVVLRNITPSPVVYFQFSPTIGESKTKGNKNETKVLKGGERKNPIPLLQQQYGGQSACRPIRHLQANHLQLDQQKRNVAMRPNARRPSTVLYTRGFESSIFFDNNLLKFRQTGTRPLHGQSRVTLILQEFHRRPVRMRVRIGHSHSTGGR